MNRSPAEATSPIADFTSPENIFDIIPMNSRSLFNYAFAPAARSW